MSGQRIAQEVDAAIREVAREVGVGSFTVSLIRVPADEPTTPWGSSPISDPQEFVLPAILDRWGKNEIDGAIIRATDKKVMVSAVGEVPTVADRLVINESLKDVAPGTEFVVEEVAGTKDGVNTAFTISGSGVVALFLNGKRQVEGTDYERSGPMITATGSVPHATDSYIAEIYVSGAAPTVEDVAGTKDGVNTAFTISKSGTVSLFLNGIRQTEGTDYTRSGTAITATGQIPGPGDSYKAVIYDNNSGIEHAILNVIPEAPSGVPLYYIIHARQ